MGIYAGNGIVLMIVSLYYLLFGFALSRLVYASFANGVFDKYLNPHIEGRSVEVCARKARTTGCLTRTTRTRKTSKST